MRSRTVREGSVGLLILLGLSLFGGLVLWLRGFSPGNRKFTAFAVFGDVAGIQTGATVRYRGVNVGKVAAITPGANGVELKMDISPADLLIPRNVVVEASQSGLIGETYIDIVPLKPIPPGLEIAKPLTPQCKTQQIIVCDQTRLPQGQLGVSTDELIRTTTRLATIYTDPAFVSNLNAAIKNTAVAAGEIATLSRNFSSLSGSLKQELKSFSGAANSVSNAANQTSYQVGLLTNRFGNTANKFEGTANELSRTAAQFNQLGQSVNSLVVENRSTLVSTLNNLSQASEQLRGSVGGLKPTLVQVTSTFQKINSEKLLRNLETLSDNAAQASANAAQASANLRDLSTNLNDPKNRLVLQQTLDSARATFENTQKITSDLDDLTGDPAFRSNLKNLVNGLGKLVSSTEQLQQQVEMAQVLEPVSDSLKEAAAKNSALNTKPPETTQELKPVVAETEVKSVP
jgi:phospholipid/cholesterol/gamma-HCH transport system substrate-binding protein